MAGSQSNINLVDLSHLVSLQNNVKIIISENLKNRRYFLNSNDVKSLVSIDVFEQLIENEGLKIAKSKDFLLVYEEIKEDFQDFNSSIEEVIENLYYIKLNNNSFEEVNLLLKQFEKQGSYIAKDNSIAFLCSEKIYLEILSAIELFDLKKISQVNFKITIFETNLDDVKEHGSNLNSLLKLSEHADFSFFINLITLPYSQETNIVTTKQRGFYDVISFLDKNNITKIKASPFLVAKNNHEVFFSSVKTVPFLVEQKNIQDAKSQNQSTYEYKDIGLKLVIKPVIVNDVVDFSFHLIYENLLNETATLTPTTTKKELKSNYSLRKGDILILSGINQEVNSRMRSGIPLLKDIFILKYLTSIEKNIVENSILSISVEIL